MLGYLGALFSPPALQMEAHRCYVAVISQARTPCFFSRWQVPDTLDGRFEMIVLHLFMVLEHTRSAPEFSRYMCEAFFADMDRSLREAGVSDTGMHRRIKEMAEAFYGRIKAYGAWQDEEALALALKRNVYAGASVPIAGLMALTAYVRASMTLLGQEPQERILAGALRFAQTQAAPLR